MSYNTIYEGKELMKRRVIAAIYPSKKYPPLLVNILSKKNNRDITAIAEYVYATLRGVERSRDINNDDFLKAMDKAFEEYGINKESLTNYTQADLNQFQEDVQTHRPRR